MRTIVLFWAEQKHLTDSMNSILIDNYPTSERGLTVDDGWSLHFAATYDKDENQE